MMIFVFTSDVDFVSDSVLEKVYCPFHNKPITIFKTGKSNYLDKSVKEEPLWEMEPHPNFLNNSTQGSSFNDILKNIDMFAGERIGYRCHRYYNSNDVTENMILKGYKYSSNVCTDLMYVKPFPVRGGIIEFPIYFEDGGYIKFHNELSLDKITKDLKEDGVYVFSFHPVHLILNSCDFSISRKIKDSLTAKDYSLLTADDFLKYKSSSYGIKNLLDDLLNFVKEHNVEMLNLRQCYERYKNNSI